MKKPILALSFLLVGCSHVPKHEKVVQFPYAAELVEKIQLSSGRTPASVELSVEEDKSTRRVYFSSLYHQYLALGTQVEEKTEIAFCPQFHHDKVDADRYAIPALSLYRPAHVLKEGKAFFPELAFSGGVTLKDYLADLRSEIEVLCEEGVSDNFYKFDNLVTHYAHDKSFHRKPKAMESVLKIPVFANFYLIKMMSTQHGVAFIHPEEAKFIELTQTFWFRDYVIEASRMRSSYTKKVVKR